MLNLTYLFCVYSILGWVIEVIFFYFKTRKFHNRGILRGTYCPLYGFSLVICTLLTVNIKTKYFVSFLICGVICTIFELITAIIFDKLLNVKLWDYNAMKFNFNGYICLLFSIIWGIIAVTCIHTLNPTLFIIDKEIKVIISVLTLLIMIADLFSHVKTNKNKTDLA